MRPIALAFLLLAPGLLAGCAGSGAGRDEPPAQVATISAEPNRGTLLRVLVITDEYFPVAKAKVILVGLGVNGTTDEWGDAFFHLATPGRYALHVHRTGFYPNQTRVVIDEGQGDAVVRVRLRDAPRDANFADFYFYEGLCGPTVYADGATASSDCTETPFFPKPRARFILGRGLVEGSIGLRWDAHAAGAQKMRIEATFPEVGAFADGRTSLVAEGHSPVFLTLPPELLTPKHRENGNSIVLNVGLARGAAAISIEQSFQIEAVFDYSIAAPDVDPEQ